MTDIEQAAALLDVDAKFFQPFDANDPFNDDARLEGFLCQKPNHTYGALALLRVDGRVSGTGHVDKPQNTISAG